MNEIEMVEIAPDQFIPEGAAIPIRSDQSDAPIYWLSGSLFLSCMCFALYWAPDVHSPARMACVSSQTTLGGGYAGTDHFARGAAPAADLVNHAGRRNLADKPSSVDEARTPQACA